MRPLFPHEFWLSEIRTQTMDPHWTSVMEIQIRTLQKEKKFQQTVVTFFQNFIFSNGRDSSKAQRNIRTAAKTEADSVEAIDLQQWDSIVSKCLASVKLKDHPENLKNFCHEMLDRPCSWRNYHSWSSSNPSSFIEATLKILKVLVISKPHVIVPLSRQIQSLEKMLEFVLIIAWVGGTWEFLEYIQPWVKCAAAVPFVFWVDKIDEEQCALFASFLKKFNPSTPELVVVYLEAIKHVKLSRKTERSRVLLLRSVLWRFIDILLENLIGSTNDSLEMLSEGLMLLTTFLVDPPEALAEDKQTNLHVGQAASLVSSLCVGKLREDTSDLLEKINKAKEELIQIHSELPGLSADNVPVTNRQGFIDFVIGNLKKKVEAEADLYTFEKHLIAIVHKQLVSLKPNLFELQDERQDIWAKAGRAAYLVDHVTDLCLSADVPIWSILTHLYNAKDQIQFIKAEVDKIKSQTSSSRAISGLTKVILPRTDRNNIPPAEDNVKVGFVVEEEKIIDRLTGAVNKRDIVAIVGMPGQGKTTLAQRVFHDSRVQCHFNKRAWCCISQAFNIKEILIDILRGLGEPISKEQLLSVSQEDLADRLRRCLLKGGRYLVVLDDIWDIRAWIELQLSFPDDNEGSRILLTSRIRNVASEIKRDCCVVELQPLLLEESWKLLQMKAIHQEEGYPPILSSIGKTIAENCKGLPLAIVLVAGLLKKDRNVESWKRIAESLKQIASDGCMDILELSYRHLPDFLKPCFLYLGTFREDETIDAKKLIQLWIAEGFVQNEGIQSLEVVANEYLNNLVSRSLVSVAKRSSRYGIKKCRVHDLLHELCLIKAEQERFFLVPNVSDHSSNTRYDPYRLCVSDKLVQSVHFKPDVWSVRSVFFSSCGYWRLRLDSPSFFTRFKLLRVMDLDKVILNSNFDDITELIHLRFLSVVLEKNVPISPSIVNLSRLEIIRLHHLSFEELLPSAMLEMAKLRHIMVSGICGLDDNQQQSSSQLTCLETFTYLRFSDAALFERVAQNIPNVRKLGVKLEFCVSLSSYFKKLESLNLEITRVNISPTTLEFPSTLKKLSLQHKRRLSGDMISSIGKLSRLEVLKLEVRFENQRWDVEDDEFLNLRYLKLRYSSIKEWSASDESFPCLEQLVVKSCNQIEQLPDRFAEVSTLKRIIVRNCPKSVQESFHKIVEEQRDSGNEGLQSSISTVDSRSNAYNRENV